MNRARRALAYSVVAAACPGAGAFLLVAVWLQVINPRLAWYEEPHGLAWYIVGSVLALILLAAAWWFNLKAIERRREVN